MSHYCADEEAQWYRHRKLFEAVALHQTSDFLAPAKDLFTNDASHGGNHIDYPGLRRLLLAIRRKVQGRLTVAVPVPYQLSGLASLTRCGRAVTRRQVRPWQDEVEYQNIL